MPLHADIPIDALQEAARRPEVIEAMQAFYEEADRRIAEHKPTCWNKGDCCRFGEYGHRLYVTSLEVVYYIASHQRDAAAAPPCQGGDGGGVFQAEPASQGSVIGFRTPLPILIPPITADACPHAQDGQCHARACRPLGCRIFYCDPAAQHWQGPLTEECLEELKRLHRELGVPYFYADWMAVLRALASA